MKVDPSKYDYVMYVDASGDDGFKFEKDSSSCYCAAALLVKQEDIPHNLAILEQIKKIVGCKATDEVKYSKVRRNRRSPEALELLKDIKGRMSCFVTFKKELAKEEIPTNGSKELSIICHIMALESIKYFDFMANDRVLIAIDRMKNTEEVPLENFIHDKLFTTRQQPDQHFSHEVLFRDSKDSEYLLIQIADLLAGIVREHFEQYETNEDMLHFKPICPNCLKLNLSEEPPLQPMCENGSSRAAKIMRSKNLHYIVHLLHPIADLTKYLFMKPTNMMRQHFYLICPIIEIIE